MRREKIWKFEQQNEVCEREREILKMEKGKKKKNFFDDQKLANCFFPERREK